MGGAFLAPIVTAEVRTDTLDCTPGARKALADAAARTTRKARSMIGDAPGSGHSRASAYVRLGHPAMDFGVSEFGEGGIHRTYEHRTPCTQMCHVGASSFQRASLARRSASPRPQVRWLHNAPIARAVLPAHSHGRRRRLLRPPDHVRLGPLKYWRGAPRPLNFHPSHPQTTDQVRGSRDR